MTDVAEKPEVSAEVKEVVEKPEEVVPTEVKADVVVTSSPNTSKHEREIIRQIEYYFGDANLARDKFLIEQIGKDEGWVPFTVLLTFKRLASLSNDIEIIAKALEKSDEGLVEISEDKTKIRRHPERPIPEQNEERRKEVASRTAYVKGFPQDIEMSDLIEFFSPYEKIVNINMRKYLDKPTKAYKFKGSVFVTFMKKEQCEVFVTKEKVEYKETELIRKWQEQYIEEKKEERAATSKKKGKVQKPEEKVIELPKGTVLHFEGCDENTTRELIKDSVVALKAEVAYIEYNRGDKSGYLRFSTENTAQPFLDKLEDKKLKLSTDVELTLRTLTEEEEKEFLGKAVEHMKSRRNNINKHHHHHHRGHNRKRRTSDHDDEPSAKH